MRLIILFLLLSLGAMAQEPPYTPMRSNYRFRGVRVDSLFMTPSFTDTTAANAVGLNTIPGNMIRVDSIIYVRTGTKWVKQGGGSAVNINTGFGLTGGPITGTGTIAADTSALATPYDLTAKLNLTDTAAMLSNYAKTNTVNTKVDSINKSSDSVYYYKNGIKYFAFKDSSGSGSSKNGRWGNDTALVIFAKVHNATGTQLLRGEIVYLSGANGDVASVKRANNKYDSTSATTIGMVKDNIASGDTGWVVTQGQISKINTSAFNSGDIIYLDSINGKFTKSKQYAPYHLVFIGVVERANAGNGQIYLKPQNGYELNEIHDVQINGKVNNQILVYSDTQKVWKNRSAYSVIDTTHLSSRIDAINLQKVTDVANTTTNSINVASIYLKDDTQNDYNGILTDDNTFIFTSGNLNQSLMSVDISGLTLYGMSNALSQITTLASTFRNYTLPDTTGTFAMRGDSTLFQTKYRSDTARTNIYNAINTKASSTGTTGGIAKFTSSTSIGNATADVDYLRNDMQLVAFQAMGSSLKGYNIGCPYITLATGSIALVNQTTTYIAIYVPTSITVTGVKWWQGTQGNYTASNYNGVGLYQAVGDSITLLASSTSDGNIWKGASGSFQTKAFSSTVAITPGIYYIGALYSNSAFTTNPAIGFSGSAAAGTINLGVLDFTGGNKMNGTAGSGLTAFANKIAKSAITATQHRLAFYLY